MLKAALLTAVLLVSPGLVSAADATAGATPARHWILKLMDRLEKAGPDADPYRAMGQLIYTAQRRDTSLDELRAAKAAIAQQEDEQGETDASQYIRAAVQILIDQHGYNPPAISAEGLGYEEFDENK